jgi:3-oxoacyl-[acyl-carrier protein] reductase
LNSLDGKVAIVTGASRGIGRAVALRLARDGAAVIVNYARNQAAAREVVDEITALGGRASDVAADVTERGAAARLFDAAAEIFGHSDILVNNAGVAAGGPLATISEET